MKVNPIKIGIPRVGYIWNITEEKRPPPGNEVLDRVLTRDGSHIGLLFISNRWKELVNRSPYETILEADIYGRW